MLQTDILISNAIVNKETKKQHRTHRNERISGKSNGAAVEPHGDGDDVHEEGRQIQQRGNKWSLLLVQCVENYKGSVWHIERSKQMNEQIDDKMNQMCIYRCAYIHNTINTSRHTYTYL